MRLESKPKSGVNIGALFIFTALRNGDEISITASGTFARSQIPKVSK
jgi:hypothetical protein